MLAPLSGGGPLFPYSRTTVRELWEEICGAAAINGVTLHRLRTTFITRGLDAGVPAVEVQRLVGHADLQCP
jgi:integrase